MRIKYAYNNNVMRTKYASGGYMEELFKKIEQNIKGDKKIILIAGASSSGKSYTAEKLSEYLEGKGKKVLQFSSDMYYKGIARLITEKTFLHNTQFVNYSSYCEDIYNNVKSIIIDSDFPEKFNYDNYLKINNYLKTIMPMFVAEKFAEKMKFEFENINFDEPFCINFDTLARDINTLLNNGKISIPKYSFKSGETTYDLKNLVCGKDYDIIIVEGLYTLRKELVSHLNNQNILKVGINCDNKTLLSRRFNRDINSNRCSFTPEQTIMLFITKVMPAFYNYIYPSLNDADIIYNSSLSKLEINNSPKSIQIKYQAPENIVKLLQTNSAKFISSNKQKDYFLEDKTGMFNNIILRIREENGLATKLTLKIKTSKLERAIQEYNLKKLLSKENRDIVKLLNLFKNSGFETTQVISKNRKIFAVAENIIKVDEVANLGKFVEIDEKGLKDVAELKKSLDLKNPTTMSYFELYVNSLSELKHNECEMKFVVKNLAEKDFGKIFKGNHIKQYYLELNNAKVIEKIDKTFNKAFNLNDISEARVRIVDNYDAYLTLKSNGLKVREEIEKEIPITFANELVKFSNSCVEKTRFKVFENDGKKVELDYYKDRELCVMEIEFDENRYMEDEITDFASSIFGDNVTLEDVTNNCDYKNKNLALDMGEGDAEE